MSSNINITIHDFENICRTCLSREDLKPLYEKCVPSCVVNMLMFCTVVKFTEDDGLPAKICINCIKEIKQAFSFGQRCETTDAILRNCVKKFKTESTNHFIPSQKVEPIIVEEEEMQIEVKQEEISPHLYQAENEVLENYECGVIVKLEEDINTGYSPEIILPTVENILDEQVKIETDKCDENDDDALNENNDEEVDGDQYEMYSHNSDSHSKVRRSARRPACHVCGKTFQSLAHLKRHNFIHTGEKPHVCSVCNRAFSQGSDLKTHMRTHTGEKPHICSVCGRGFAQTNNLINHKRIHTGEKPYPCTDCDKSFATNRTLRRHKQKWHGLSE